MAQLRVGGKVPNRRPRPNPWTMSGRPQWNTFAGLDCAGTAKELNRGVNTALREAGVGKALPGRRSRFKPAKKLDPSNIAHRAKEGLDRKRGHFDKLRVLSLEIDRMKETPQIDRAMRVYNERLLALVQLRGQHYIEDLIRLEAARGVRRAATMFRA